MIIFQNPQLNNSRTDVIQVSYAASEPLVIYWTLNINVYIVLLLDNQKDESAQSKIFVVFIQNHFITLHLNLAFLLIYFIFRLKLRLLDVFIYLTI
jgi:hypothetical protein